MPEKKSLKTTEAHRLYSQFRKASLKRTGVYAQLHIVHKKDKFQYVLMCDHR